MDFRVAVWVVVLGMGVAACSASSGEPQADEDLATSKDGSNQPDSPDLLGDVDEVLPDSLVDLQEETFDATDTFEIEPLEIIEEVEDFEICEPNCGGMECGDDGCQGSCGTCQEAFACIEGACIAIECTKTPDCPGQLVCDTESNTCVDCVQDSDCANDAECGPDYECHSLVECASDIACKDLGWVCDTENGQCVQCLVSAHCEDSQFCLKAYCVPDICPAEQGKCEGQQAMQCREDGSGWENSEVCTAEQYCDQGGCFDYLCLPGSSWCEEDTLVTCSADGKSIAGETSCLNNGDVCMGNSCIELTCDPGAQICVDEFNYSVCSQDGLHEATLPCPAGHYCDEGICHSFLCQPGALFCDANVFKICNTVGNGVTTEINCEGQDQVCTSEGCADTVCLAGHVFCEDALVKAVCAEDGLSYVAAPCPEGTYCHGGVCHSQVCTPSSVYCDGNWASICNSYGSAVLNQLDCDELFCLDGQCLDVICTAETRWCDGQDVIECNAQGTATEAVEECTQTQYCENDGDTAACHDQICVPGSFDCDNTTVMQCNDSGSAKSAVTNCADDGQICVNGGCVEPVCVGNSAFCEGNTVMRCNAVGSSASLESTCSATQYCQNDGGTAACHDQICIPGSFDCDGSLVKQCNDLGSQKVTITNCAEDGNMCVDGECLALVCEAGTTFCDGNVVMACNGIGTSASVDQNCPPDEYCAETSGSAACMPQVCVPGAQFCVGTSVWLCNAQGSQKTLQEACADSGATCVAGECVPVVCEAGSTYCQDNKVMACNGAGTSASLQQACTTGQYCEEEGTTAACHDQICTPNAQYCAGTHLMQCNENGSQLSETVDCATTGQTCVAGACEDVVCVANSTFCIGETRHQGNASGTANTVVEECAGDQYCKEVGTTASCADQVCTPNAIYCVGTHLMECNANGSLVTETVNCADSGQGCLTGGCVNLVCNAGEQRCLNGHVEQCSADGLSYFVADTCGETQYCEEDGTAAECLDMVCTPNAQFCAGTRIMLCNTVGSGVTELQNCSATGQTCAAGTCENIVCVANSTFCIGETLHQCNASGTAATVLEECAGDKYCKEVGTTASCADQVCTPNAIYCVGAHLMECNANGSLVAEIVNCADSGQGCLTGSCVDLVCNAGEQQCLNGNVEQCSADGLSYFVADTCGETQYCQEDGTTAECLDQVCWPDQLSCLGTRIMLCNAKGSLLTEVADCADESKGCQDAICVASICDPEASFCDGTTVRQCASDGMSSTLIDSCDTDQYCLAQGSSAGCADQICTPYAKSCLNNKVMVCNNIGSGMSELSDCGSSFCESGVCLSDPCGSTIFDGINDRVVVADDAVLRPGHLTLAAWIKPTSLGYAETLIAKADIGDGTHEQYSLGLKNSRVRLGIKRNSGCSAGVGWNFLSGNTTLTEGDWYHVAATWDGTSMRVYVNGVLDGTGTAPAGEIDDCSGGQLRFGYWWSGDTLAYDGAMSQVGIWSRALDEAELHSLLDGHFSTFPDSGLVGWWPLSEGSGTAAADQSGYGNDGVLDGASWSTEGGTLNCRNALCEPDAYFCLENDVYVCNDIGSSATFSEACGSELTCVMGSCTADPCHSLQFDGINDYLDVSNGFTWEIQGSITKFVDLWVYLESKEGGLVNIGTNTYESGRTFRFRTNSNGQLGLDVSYGSAYSSLTVPLNQWTYVFAGWDQSTSTYFVGMLSDGELEQQVLYGLPPNNLDSSPCYVGQVIDGFYMHQYLEGKVDRVRFWREIPADSTLLASLCTNIGTGAPPGLLAEYNMEEGSGTAVSNSTSTYYGGTLEGGATWDLSGPNCGATPPCQN